MELRSYARILARRWWAIALPVLVVLAASAFQRPPTPVYTVTTSVLLDLPPLAAAPSVFVDPRLTAPQATEYLVDDFSAWVKGDEFARLVAARLPANLQSSIGQISSSTSAEKRHRSITIAITRSEPSDAVAQQELPAISQAVVVALREDSPKYFVRLTNGQPEISIIDGPHVARVSGGLRDRLDVPLRILLAVLGGAGLAFLLHYLDTRIYDPAEVEAMGVMVLAEVPPVGGKPGVGRRTGSETVEMVGSQPGGELVGPRRSP